MDIYVYVDDAPYRWEDVTIQIVLPMTDKYFIGDEENELGDFDQDGNKRLNIKVDQGFDNGLFSSEILQQLKLWYNLSYDGIGDVYLICNGEKSIITDLVSKYHSNV